MFVPTLVQVNGLSNPESWKSGVLYTQNMSKNRILVSLDTFLKIFYRLYCKNDFSTDSLVDLTNAFRGLYFSM